MNYFAHAFRFLESQVDPLFLAGLAVPDWLNVVNRKTKARSRTAQKRLAESGDLEEQSLATGVIQHHLDDHWFHQTPVFNELMLEFTMELRDLLAEEAGFRPSFLGHILVELLLDDFLIQENPSRIQSYYRLMQKLNPTRTEELVSRMTNQPAENLSRFVSLFSSIQFLYDYHHNEKLLGRLNQVMQRVRLLPLPETLFGFFDSARARIAQNVDRLFFEPARQPENNPSY